MKKEWRLSPVLSAVVPLAALLFYFLASSEDPASTPHPPNEGAAEGARKPPTEMSLHPNDTIQPVPNANAPAPSRAKVEEPESEELFWNELERLERKDKQEALAYALAGDDWYSDEGTPAEARRAKIVTLLVSLGKMEEARAKTRVFIEKYPDSSYRRLVQGVTGIHPRPSAPRAP